MNPWKLAKAARLVLDQHAEFTGRPNAPLDTAEPWYETGLSSLEAAMTELQHCHESNGENDACKLCGLDLRDTIHARVPQ
jgi:hypothetical protein